MGEPLLEVVNEHRGRSILGMRTGYPSVWSARWIGSTYVGRALLFLRCRCDWEGVGRAGSRFAAADI